MVMEEDENKAIKQRDKARALLSNLEN